MVILGALAATNLAGAVEGVVVSLRDLQLRVPSTWMWDSVYNEAQFTLQPYLTIAKGAEIPAARTVLEVLKRMAGAPPAEVLRTPVPRRKRAKK